MWKITHKGTKSVDVIHYTGKTSFIRTFLTPWIWSLFYSACHWLPKASGFWHVSLRPPQGIGWNLANILSIVCHRTYPNTLTFSDFCWFCRIFPCTHGLWMKKIGGSKLCGIAVIHCIYCVTWNAICSPGIFTNKMMSPGFAWNHCKIFWEPWGFLKIWTGEQWR
jgi:hypothetical protein